MTLIEASEVREAVLALEGTVIDDLQLPLPGDLMDISKAAALVSGVVEDRIPALLNSVRSTTWDEDGGLGAYEFRKSAIGFPDVLLVERSNPENVVFEIEAKSWYILSSDPLTARFETSEAAIGEGTLVVVASWMLDGVVSGSPKILRIYVDDAKRLAKVRDARWESIDANHRVVEPTNPPGTPRNLRSTQVRGEVQKGGRWIKDADNFGKLDRLYDPSIQAFRDEVWKLEAAGKTLDAWRTFVKSSDVVIDDADLDAAQASILRDLTEAAEVVHTAIAHRDALVAAAVELGLEPRAIRRATGLTLNRIATIAAAT